MRLFSLPTLWVLLCFSITTSLPAGATTIDLDSGWQYRWGDSPLDENGLPAWTRDSVDEAWQPIGFPSNPPGRDDRHNAWFRITLPEGDWRDPVVYIYSVDLIVQVYLEANLIYQYGAFDQDGRGRFEGWPWHLIELPEDFGDQTLYFRVFSDYTDIGLWGEVMLMERPELFVYILERSAKAMATSGFSLLIALLTFIFALLQTNRRSFAAIGLFSLASGTMILAESQASQLLFEAPLFWDTLAAGSYFLLPVALALLLEHWMDGRYSWVMRLLWQSHLLYAALALGLSLSGVVDLSTTYPPFDALLVVSLIIMLGPVLVVFRQLTLVQKAIIAASGFYSLLLIADMAVAHGLITWRRIPVSLGALGFSLAMVAISLADYGRTQREIQRLNHELKKEVAARTQELEDLVETLRDYSYQDPLTGLKNRRHFEELLVHESDLARRNRTPLALVMLDIDHFKQFNDRYGHETGDAVLASVGALLREHFRDADVVCRLGGEEFIVVLPGATSRRAEARIQALLHAIRNNQFRHLDAPLDEVTLSCGIAAYPQHTHDPAELVTLADQALYRAKHAGRDRCETYVASVAK